MNNLRNSITINSQRVAITQKNDLEMWQVEDAASLIWWRLVKYPPFSKFVCFMYVQKPNTYHFYPKTFGYLKELLKMKTGFILSSFLFFFYSSTEERLH